MTCPYRPKSGEFSGPSAWGFIVLHEIQAVGPPPFQATMLGSGLALLAWGPSRGLRRRHGFRRVARTRQGPGRATAPSACVLRFANSVRISGKCYSNRATFPPHEILAFPTAYSLRTKSAKSTGSESIGPRREISGLFWAEPVNRSAPKTPGILPSSGRIGRAERADHFETGGGGATRYNRSQGWSLGEHRASAAGMGVRE
jgi:hypothetical protein